MNLFEWLVLALRVKAGADMLFKMGIPQVVKGLRYKGMDYQITIEREREKAE